MNRQVRTVGHRAAPAMGLLVAVLLVSACSSAPTSLHTPTVVSGTVSGGKLKIGIDEDQPGLGLKSGDTYSGFDVDTARYVAAALGVPTTNITWVEATPANREKLLESGSVDLIFSTYSITASRRKVVDFAGPYFVAHQDLLVRRNDTDITGPETVNGHVLCSVTGTTSSAYIKQHYRGTIDLKEYGTYSACVAALADSQVDAVTTDDVILAGFAATPQYKGKLKLVGKGFTDEDYGVGIKKGDSAMVAKVNAALRQYISDGSWRASLDDNVHPSGYSIPNPPTPGS